MASPLVLIIVLLSTAGTIDVYLAPDTASIQFDNSFEGTKRFLSWASTRIPKDSDAKICVLEIVEQRAPANVHSYLSRERRAAGTALGTDYSYEFGSYKTMQQVAQLYGKAVDYQLAQRFCD